MKHLSVGRSVSPSIGMNYKHTLSDKSIKTELILNKGMTIPDSFFFSKQRSIFSTRSNLKTQRVLIYWANSETPDVTDAPNIAENGRWTEIRRSMNGANSC